MDLKAVADEAVADLLADQDHGPEWLADLVDPEMLDVAGHLAGELLEQTGHVANWELEAHAALFRAKRDLLAKAAT